MTSSPRVPSNNSPDEPTRTVLLLDAMSAYLRDALEAVARAADVPIDTDYGLKPNGILLDDILQASKCAICDEWTPDSVHGGGNLLDPSESVCKSHFDDDDEAAAWLLDRHPFTPGIEIAASW